MLVTLKESPGSFARNPARSLHVGMKDTMHSVASSGSRPSLCKQIGTTSGKDSGGVVFNVELFHWSQDRKADKSSLRRAYWSDRTLNLGRTEEHEHLIGITQEHGGVHGKQLQSCATAASVCRSHAQTGLSAARHQQMPSSVLSEHAVPTAPFSDHAETLHVGAG